MLTMQILKGTDESKSYKPISELSVDWSIKTRVTFTAHQVGTLYRTIVGTTGVHQVGTLYRTMVGTTGVHQVGTLYRTMVGTTGV